MISCSEDQKDDRLGNKDAAIVHLPRADRQTTEDTWPEESAVESARHHRATRAKRPNGLQLLSQPLLLTPSGFKCLQRIYSKRSSKREQGREGINSPSLWHS